MKSIYFLTYDLSTGGTEKVVVYLANYFASKNNKVTLLTVFSTNDLKHIIDPKIEVVSFNQKKISNFILPFLSYVKKKKIDCLISNVWPLTVISSFVFLFKRNAKLLLVDHCVLEEEFRKKNYLFKLFQNISIKIFYRFCDAVVGVSGGVKNDLITKGVKPSKITVIYNPLPEVEVKQITNQAKDVDEWLNSSCKKIISVGRLKKEKNIPNLIKAITAYKKRYSSEIKVLIVGDGEEKKAIESLVEKEDLRKDIFVPGWMKDPLPYINKADLLVLSSDYEGFGLVIAEALSVGTTVVSTDCISGPKEILKDGELGYLCKTNDPEDLAKAINKGLRQPLDKDKLISRAKDFSLMKNL